MCSARGIEAGLAMLDNIDASLLALLPQEDQVEKLIHLELQGPPAGVPNDAAARLNGLADALGQFAVENTRVVVLGGGTGLSNIIGGDSRKTSWPNDPFRGLKEIFPKTRAIVCVTDDGGSTGELLKDLPFIALGDIRHVMLSAIQKQSLREKYGLDDRQCMVVAGCLHKLFNYRFEDRPGSKKELADASGLDPAGLPEEMHRYLAGLLELLFEEPFLANLLSRTHCLGNLLLAAAVWQDAAELHGPKKESCQPFESKNYTGLKRLSRVLALDEGTVMPCSLTPAALQILYTNGALVTGEYKSGHAGREYPVDRLFVRFVEEPQPDPEVIRSIKDADMIILAPGSLYTSTIPIFQVPGMADAVRDNRDALKILVPNLWVQRGETDVVRDDPKRRFHVSDLIKAYNRNIPGGVRGLFSHVLALGLQDISGAVLQNYAMEDKVPIFLDRESVFKLGFRPVEAGIFSLEALRERNVIQHDPAVLARVIRTLFAVTIQTQRNTADLSGGYTPIPGYFRMEKALVQDKGLLPCQRFTALRSWLDSVELRIDSGMVSAGNLSAKILDVLWYHQDILVSHLENIDAIRIIERKTWSRNQEWDNLYSFYDPWDKTIKICQDVVESEYLFEQSFLVALGQALLGNYAASKEMAVVEEGGEPVGRIYRLTIKPPEQRNTYLSEQSLGEFLKLARMIKSEKNENLFTRLVNGDDRFTPPGLLFGLLFAWYLDNRFAAHVEYKMAIMRTDVSDLIPEQIKMLARRRELVRFFRQSVFGHISQVYNEEPR